MSLALNWLLLNEIGKIYTAIYQGVHLCSADDAFTVSAFFKPFKLRLLLFSKFFTVAYFVLVWCRPDDAWCRIICKSILMTLCYKQSKKPKLFKLHPLTPSAKRGYSGGVISCILWSSVDPVWPEGVHFSRKRRRRATCIIYSGSRLMETVSFVILTSIWNTYWIWNCDSAPWGQLWNGAIQI